MYFFAIDYFVVDSLFYFTAFTALKEIESKNANNKQVFKIILGVFYKLILTTYLNIYS